MITTKLGKVGKVWILASSGHPNLEFRKKPSKETIKRRMRQDWGKRLALGEELVVELVSFG